MMFVAALGAKLVAAAPAVIAGAGKVASVAGSVASSAKGLSVLQGVSSGFQALSNFSAGRSEQNALYQQASDAELAASADQTNAARRINTLNDNFLNVAGDQRVAFASGGLDLGSGSLKQARRIAARETRRQVADVQSDSDLRQAGLRSKAKGLRDKGDHAAGAGVFSAFGNIVGGLSAIKGRG